MTYLDNKRLNLVYRLLGAKMQSTQAFSGYLSTGHNYSPQSVLHMREAHFITAILPGEAKTMSAVAETLAVTQGAASQTAARLEKKGYILRFRSPEDRRIVLVSLTEKGEEFYRDHVEYDTQRFREIEEKVTARYTNEELEMLLDYEERMTSLFIEYRN